MTQIAELSEAEIEARFNVTGKRPVAFMLAGFCKERAQFAIQFGNGEHFLSTLLAVDADLGRLIFDCSGSADLNRRFAQVQRAVFVGRPGGIHVQFKADNPREINYEGAKAFAVGLPEYLVRLQRREAFRIETPRVKPLEFFGHLPEGGLLRLPVHDISVAGLAVTVAELPAELVLGMVLPRCHCRLPEETHDFTFSATVCHLTELGGRLGASQWRIGLHFNDLPASEEMRIQRYIARVERERHELS